jgi:hypothetical protein
MQNGPTSPTISPARTVNLTEHLTGILAITVASFLVIGVAYSVVIFSVFPEFFVLLKFGDFIDIAARRAPLAVVVTVPYLTILFGTWNVRGGSGLAIVIFTGGAFAYFLWGISSEMLSSPDFAAVIKAVIALSAFGIMLSCIIFFAMRILSLP